MLTFSSFQFLIFWAIFKSLNISFSGRLIFHTKKPKKMCDTSTGDGTYTVYCSSSPHKGSNKCVYHCKLCDDHCTFFVCDSLPHKGSNRCEMHCTWEGHGHCPGYVCDSPPHEGSNRCEMHCEWEGHGHCADDDCVSPPHEGSYDCVEHSEKKITGIA